MLYRRDMGTPTLTAAATILLARAFRGEDHTCRTTEEAPVIELVEAELVDARWFEIEGEEREFVVTLTGDGIGHCLTS